jgi:hypothetical protein
MRRPLHLPAPWRDPPSAATRTLAKCRPTHGHLSNLGSRDSHPGQVRRHEGARAHRSGNVTLEPGQQQGTAAGDERSFSTIITHPTQCET